MSFGLVALTILLSMACTPSAAQSTRSAVQTFDWRATAKLEHEDRKNRFNRLSAAGLIATPQFHEDLIKRSELAAIGVDLPILRLVFAQQAFFDTDKSELRPDALKSLDLVAESLRKDVPDVAMFVAGHTDGRGSDEYNYTLSVARADTVARYLYTRGVGLARLWRIGFGKGVPLKPNTSADNMAVNRRVEFLFAARPEAVAVWLSKQSTMICSAANPNERSDCRTSVSVLPPIVATPVLNERPTVVEPLQKRTSTAIEGQKDIVTASVGTTSVEQIAKKETAEIEKNSQIIIDLKEQRVTVGAPQL